MAKNLVDSVYEDNIAITKFLEDSGQISFLTSVDNSFRKVLLIAAASYFENVFIETVVGFAELQLRDGHPLFTLVKTQGIDRKYHTWFDWGKSDAKQFFALFGAKFRNFMKKRVDADHDLQKGIARFMEIGTLRNSLVHGNFAEFTVEKTAAEIYESYKAARLFVEAFATHLDDFMALADLEFSEN